MIEFDKLSKNYNGFFALKDATHNLAPGKMTIILGENGSGKTTLLKLLAKQTDISIGNAYLDHCEIDTYNSKDYAKKVSVLNQVNTQSSRVKVEKFVSYGRYPYSQNKLTVQDHKHIQESMEYVDCASYKDKYIDQLSGGQLQRVYLALLLCQDSEIILLDEPLNHLDMKHSHELMRLLQNMTTNLNKTVVVVMHDVNMCMQYGDEVIAFKEGQIIDKGPVEETLTQELLRDIFELDFEIIKHKNKPYVLVVDKEI